MDHFLKVRVKSEHAMGYFKGRFASMRGLRQQIDDATDHERAIAWIKTCIVIHTMAFFIENGNEDPEFVEELIRDGLSDPSSTVQDDVVAEEAVRESFGQRMRTYLKESLFESMSNN